MGQRPRYAPDRDFDTVHVALELDIDFRRRSARAVCRAHIVPYEIEANVAEFDAEGFRVRSVAVKGAPARFTHQGGKLRVSLPSPLIQGDRAEIEVRYEIREPRAGLRFVSPGEGSGARYPQLWSQGQPEEARFWFPCHDNPHEKATSEVRAVVPRGFTAVSNGRLVAQERSGGKDVFHWRMDRPHALYLISLAVGRFARVEQRADGVPVVFYCEAGREADAVRGLGKTAKALEYFARMTGVSYPYPQYAQVAAAEFPGGMENTSSTTQTDAVLIDERAALDTDMDLLVAHELAHQWFGDLVTCRDWSHAWLNEGFATYFEILFQGYDKGRDEADYELFRNAHLYFEEDARRYRRPVVCQNYNNPWSLFDRHTYEKGAWVLHMLKHELGEDLWWRGVGEYLRRHKDRSVETDDFAGVLTELSGRNFKPFFDQWLHRPGYPTFRLRYDEGSSPRSAALWVHQTNAAGRDAESFKVKAVFRFSGRTWEREFIRDVSEKMQELTFLLPGEPLNVEFDPDQILLKKARMIKPHSMWRHQLLQSRSAIGRIEAAFELARLNAAGTVRLLEGAVRRERFWGAACEIARALGRIPSEEARGVLEGLLTADHPKLRRQAASSLANFAQKAPGKLARLARRDPSIHVAAEAIRTLGALDSRYARPILMKGLRQKSWRDTVSAGAVAGLAWAKNPGDIRILKKAAMKPNGYGTRSQAIRALAGFASIDRGIAPFLRGRLEDADERIVLSAVSALGDIEDKGSAAVLGRLSREAARSRVRLAAREALFRIRAGIEN
jgi:aminopeptidase N